MKLDLVLRRTAGGLTLLLVAAGVAFAIGNLFDDPGGWAAALGTAAILVPLVAVTVMAARAPAPAGAVLTVGLALFVVLAVVLAFVNAGVPIIPVMAMILALPIAVLGQRRARPAGILLLIEAAAALGVVLVRLLRESGEGGAHVGALLTGSTGMVVVPLLVLAGLFLAAGMVRSSGPRPAQAPRQPASRA